MYSTTLEAVKKCGGRSFFALALALGGLAAETRGADWPEFRGPTANGVAAATLPITWSDQENVRWRTALEGDGWSSPVVAGDRVYVTLAEPDPPEQDTSGYQLGLTILDVATGAVVKHVKLFSTSDAVSIHTKNSHASPTPLVHEGRVYLHFGHQGTACTSLDGEIVWRNDRLSYPPVHGNGGSPVLADGHLIFTRDGKDISEITALQAETGKIAWQTQRDVEATKRFSFCTPAVIEVQGQRQVVVPGSNVVQSVNPSNGAEIWRVTYDGYSVVPRPIYAEGLVFVCTGFNKPSLLAIDPRGNGDVTDTHVQWSVDSNIPKTPSLVSWGGKIAMVSDEGIAICYSCDRGDLMWKQRIGGKFSASPLLSERYLYLLSEAGAATVLDISQAKPEKVASNALGERVLASPAVIGGDLLIRTADALYRIGGS